MLKTTRFFLFTLLSFCFFAQGASAQTETKSLTNYRLETKVKSKQWDNRVSTNTLYLLGGAPNFEIEFSPEGRWTTSIGAFHIGFDGNFLFDIDVTGANIRWNYYTAKNTSANSFVFGLGLSVFNGTVKFLGLEASAVSAYPEASITYQWNLNPVSIKLGAGIGIVNHGLIFSAGYAF